MLDILWMCLLLLMHRDNIWYTFMLEIVIFITSNKICYNQITIFIHKF